MARILTSSEESDLSWWFNESAGSLGLKAQSYDATGTQSADVPGHAVDSFNQTLTHVARERRIRQALARMDSGDRIVLSLYYTRQRNEISPLTATFGDLAPLVNITYAAMRKTLTSGERQRGSNPIELSTVSRYVERGIMTEGSSEFKREIAEQAVAMLRDAQKAYVAATHVL